MLDQAIVLFFVGSARRAPAALQFGRRDVLQASSNRSEPGSPSVAASGCIKRMAFRSCYFFRLANVSTFARLGTTEGSPRLHQAAPLSSASPRRDGAGSGAGGTRAVRVRRYPVRCPLLTAMKLVGTVLIGTLELIVPLLIVHTRLAPPVLSCQRRSVVPSPLKSPTSAIDQFAGRLLSKVLWLTWPFCMVHSRLVPLAALRMRMSSVPLPVKAATAATLQPDGALGSTALPATAPL